MNDPQHQTLLIALILLIYLAMASGLYLLFATVLCGAATC
jgi:hypothetical protein